MAPKVEKKPTEKKVTIEGTTEESAATVKTPVGKKPRAEKKLPSRDSSASTDKKKKRKAKSIEAYKICIFNVLKHAHPDIRISSKAMGIMISLINDIFEKLAQGYSESGSRLKQSSFHLPHRAAMPKQIHQIKNFLLTARRKDAR